MKRRLSSRLLLAFGLASLVLSSVLAAIYIGLVPDRDNAVRAGRLSLAESMAISTALLLTQNDRRQLEELLGFMRERNPDLQSVGVRRVDGALVVELGEHTANWQAPPEGSSTDTFVQVPILGDLGPWGVLELRFSPLRAEGWLGWLQDPRVELSIFLFGAGLVSFFLYLRRMLRHLDPSRVIPTRVRTALDTLTEGLMVLDQKGAIVLANQSLATLFGKEPDALLGVSAAGLPWISQAGAAIRPDELPWAATLGAGEARQNGLVYLQGAGGRYTFRVNASPVTSGNGRQQGVLVSFQDITELEQKEVALRAAKEEADSANRAKSAFLANMSHEIRTPMNAILGFTEVLRRGKRRSEEDVARHLDTIATSGKHLLELINDILDLSKVESGRLEVERVPFACHEVLRQVVEALSVKAAEKGIELALDYPTPLPEAMLGDPSRLRQIITNLVGNALKFTERGGVRVRPRLEGERILIDVEDTGIGIAADKLDAVFQPFMQAESSTTRRFGGTGLGLTISRQFAQAMGGDIVVASEPGRGSVFTVRLDPGPLDGVVLLAPAELAARAGPRRRRGDACWQFPPKHVLVVDDGAENRELARVVLEDAGLRVSEAENGEIAIGAVVRGGIDLVLMDVQMPVMDGYTATRMLRDQGCCLPILALTANAMKGFEREIEAAGFSGYLTKPVDIPLLLEDLAGRLGARKLDDAEPPTVEMPAVTASAARSGPPLVSRLANHPRLAAVARRFAEELPKRLEAMGTALGAAQFAELARLAHWLKGAGGSVGYDAFFEPARRLELSAKAADSESAAAELAGLADLAARIVPPPVSAPAQPRAAGASS
jgi:PAS domain S-box-containing protein